MQARPALAAVRITAPADAGNPYTGPPWRASLSASVFYDGGRAVPRGAVGPDAAPAATLRPRQRRSKGGRMSTAPTTVTEDVGMPDPGAIMQLGTAFWASKTLLSAVELGLFSELAANGPGDAEALRARLGLHPRSARDFFDALVALGMLERTRRRLRQHGGDRAVPRPRQAELRRRDARDAERAAVRVLELAHRRPADGGAAERGAHRRRLLREALLRPGGAAAAS